MGVVAGVWQWWSEQSEFYSIDCPTLAFSSQESDGSLQPVLPKSAQVRRRPLLSTLTSICVNVFNFIKFPLPRRRVNGRGVEICCSPGVEICCSPTACGVHAPCLLL